MMPTDSNAAVAVIGLDGLNFGSKPSTVAGLSAPYLTFRSGVALKQSFSRVIRQFQIGSRLCSGNGY
jgi:hypothetical protein